MKKTTLPGWLPHTALIVLLLASLMRPSGMSLTPFALVAAVFAVLQATLLATPPVDGSPSWGALIKSLLGPSVLPVYGLAVAGMLYLDHGDAGSCGHCGSGAGGCTSCGGKASTASVASSAQPTMCGGHGCGGSASGCGGGNCGKAGGCGGGCGGAKKSTAAAQNIPPPRVNMGTAPVAASNLPGMNGPNARPLPAGLVPKTGVAPAAAASLPASTVSSPPPNASPVAVNPPPAAPVAAAVGVNAAPPSPVPPPSLPATSAPAAATKIVPPVAGNGPAASASAPPAQTASPPSPVPAQPAPPGN